MNRFTKITAATAIAATLGAIPASQAFAASKTENALIGAAVGALGGALVSRGSTGVLAGAAIGAGVGLATDKPDYDRYGRRIVRDRRVYEPAPVYRSSSRGYGYGDYGYAQPSYGYAQPTYGYAQPSYGYSQPRYSQSRYGYGY